ncbi:MAG: hypothetical protein AMXMBFR45_01930 [Gammaproteobacteria bacterium]|nr:MAG: hypothetical protein BroJett010_24580 [Gammaproteobacteria bacterium]
MAARHCARLSYFVVARRNRNPLRLILAAALMLAPLLTLAAGRYYLARDEPLCDTAGKVCLLATLSYDSNSRELWLRGRIERADGPGVLRLMLSGTSRPGEVHYTSMDIDIRGRATEIVDFHMIPDEPRVENWRLDRVGFTARTQR